MNSNNREPVRWAGVMPAVTTPFDEQGAVDHSFLSEHCSWQVDHGATGIIPCGSLGEGATLAIDEKVEMLRVVVEAVGDRVPVIPGIAALSTAEAVRFSELSQEVGCRGLMVLPPYVHRGPWAETEAHIETILKATDLPCILYNNPQAYGVDIVPEVIVELASRHDQLRAVKESSGDTRRVTAVKALVGDRLSVFAGLDDMIVEAVRQGASGWVAGLVNALPAESVKLFDLAVAGLDDPQAAERADTLYRWFLPLLRLDVVPEFVQLIKLVQQEVGRGNERVRMPRQEVSGALRETALATIGSSLQSNPLN